jgi:hypothetical protein
LKGAEEAVLIARPGDEEEGVRGPALVAVAERQGPQV